MLVTRRSLSDGGRLVTLLSRAALVLLLASSGLTACSDDSSPVGNDAGNDAQLSRDGAAPKPDAPGADVMTRDAPPPLDFKVPADLSKVRPDALAQTWPQLQNVTLYVNLGDSIAAGYGVSRSYANLLYTNQDSIYPAYKGKDLSKRFTNLDYHDGAISGSTSAQMVQQLSKVPANPSGHTLVTISAGGNDLLFNYTVIFDPAKVKNYAAQVTANLKKAVDHFADKQRYPGGATVVFFNLYNPTDGVGTIPASVPVVSQCGQFKQALELLGPLLLSQLALYNSELAKWAAATPGIYLADIHNAFLGHGYHYADSAAPFYNAADPTLWFSYDCIHPNQAGHLGLRELVWTSLFGS